MATRWRAALLLGLSAALMAVGNWSLPGSSFGQQFSPGGVLTWNQLYVVSLVFLGGGVAVGCGAWPRSVWCAAGLALVPIGGAALEEHFC